MAYVVLALGILMAAAGLYSMVFGYPLIETERGPSSIIAGSVLLSGGLVVVALGLATRVLTEIRAAIRAQQSPIAETLPAAVRIDPPSVHDAGPALAGAAGAAAALRPPEPFHEPAHDEPPMLEPTADPIAAPPLPAAEPVATHSEPEHHAGQAAKTGEPAPDGYELQSPSTPDHDITPREPIKSPSEEGDWLDRALSDFETGLSSTHPAEILAPEHVPTHAAEDAAAIQAEIPPIQAEPAAPEPAGAGSTLIEPAHPEPAEPAHAAATHGEPVLAEHPNAEPAYAEPERSVAGPQPRPTHDPAPHDLAVIGRYESDGTSYVMYADGSIEAQSDAGVYRFRSMAELKAFIEG